MNKKLRRQNYETHVSRKEKALEIKNLSHAFKGKSALSEVSFDVKCGEFTVLLGKNGAGKTTLFSLITRLFNNAKGEISIFGERIDKKPSWCLSNLGVVFQQRTLEPDLTVRQNLYYQGLLHGMPKALIFESILEEAKRLDIGALMNTKIRNLSGGQARRVEIVRALLHEPNLLLMDEATVGLDQPSRDSIIAHARTLCKTRNVALLWATHLMDEVQPTDSVVILEKGKILKQATADKIIKEMGVTSIADAFGILTKH